MWASSATRPSWRTSSATFPSVPWREAFQRSLPGALVLQESRVMRAEVCQFGAGDDLAWDGYVSAGNGRRCVPSPRLGRE